MPSNIPVAPAYEAYISQLIRYSRSCASYQDFIDRGLQQTRKLLSNGNIRVITFGRHHDLVDRCEIYGNLPNVVTANSFLYRLCLINFDYTPAFYTELHDGCH